MNIAVCTTAIGAPNWRYVESIMGLRVPGRFTFKRVHGKDGVAGGHNRLIKWFLATDNDWMLHLDADACVHPYTLERLLSWDEPLVSALAFKRAAPYVPVVFIGETNRPGEFDIALDLVKAWAREHPDLLAMNKPALVHPRPDDALVAVDRTGAHCTLIHRRVFEAIEPPWFECSGKNAWCGSGSDFDFHAKALAAGFTSYVDLSVVAGHLNGDSSIGLLDFMAWDAVTEWETKEITIPTED